MDQQSAGWPQSPNELVSSQLQGLVNKCFVKTNCQSEAASLRLIEAEIRDLNVKRQLKQRGPRPEQTEHVCLTGKRINLSTRIHQGADEQLE